MDASAVIDILRAARARRVDRRGSSASTCRRSSSIASTCSRSAACCAIDPALQFAFLVDVTAVDYLPATPRFEVVYHLACLGEAYADRARRRRRGGCA